ncbi:hypothetical protein I6E29_01675 [Arcanobacterium haemolyticum]|nr:hypothetical protein [Arcanobacterium haemolyticum]
MRIYIPATNVDLTSTVVSARRVHAVTPALERELPSEEPEVWEAVAMNAAADESLALVGAALEGGAVTARRCVVAAEVPDSMIGAAQGEDLLPTAVALTRDLEWAYVVSLHVDDAGVEALVVRAAEGEESAFDELVDEDLMWFDVEELPFLAQELKAKA